jgi:hypothetical protein
MAGELNFGLLDPNLPAKTGGSFINAYQQGVANDRANALAANQQQQATTQNQLAQYQLGAAKRSDEQQNALNTLMSQGFDPANASHLSKLPMYGAPGLAILKGLQQQQFQAAKLAGEKVVTQGKELDVIKKQKEFIDQTSRDLSNNPSDANITANLEDFVASPYFTDQQKATAQQKAQRLLSLPLEARKAEIGVPGASAADLKPVTSVVDQGGQKSIVQTPSYGGVPVTAGVYKDTPLSPEVYKQKFGVAAAGAPTVNVSTEKKYGEVFGGKVADTDVVLLETARKAPEQATNANRILELTKNPNLFAGSGAEIKLKIAKALGMLGKDTGESAANTEALISATAQATLNAIKSSGLGAGQGFTDTDLKFLQGTTGGNITLEKATIARLADLQHRAAVESVKKWEARKSTIPQSALDGTGVGLEKFNVPKKFGDTASVNPYVQKSDAEIKKALGL